MVLDSLWVQRSKIWAKRVLELFLFSLAAIHIKPIFVSNDDGCVSLNLSAWERSCFLRSEHGV